jgi:DNA-binding NtrC family response regulator
VGKKSESDFATERDILYKVLFDMKSDLHDLKKLTLELMKNGSAKTQEINTNLIQKIYGSKESESEISFEEESRNNVFAPMISNSNAKNEDDFLENDNYLFAETVEEVEEILRLEKKEIEMIKKAIEKNKGKRKAAADELGISERTLYRKIKQYDL